MGQIRVLIVDDSAVIRRAVSTVLEADPDIEVVGTAANGQIALDRLDALKPDIITLDIEMPVMDGISALKEIRKRYARLPVIMFSTLTERGASATLDALVAGASDYVTKPSHVRDPAEAITDVREQLVPRIKALCAARLRVRLPGAPQGTRRPQTAPFPGRNAARDKIAPIKPLVPAKKTISGKPRKFEVVAIGCSTGGPDALSKVLAQLPGKILVPIVVVQHMPPVFTRLFAERLDRITSLNVKEAEHDEELKPGWVYVAPGERHLEVRRQRDSVFTVLTDAPPENFCRPAVDVLFRSVAAVYGSNCLSAILTGMGRDGLLGARDIRAAGGEIIAQDEVTSVVWGMPGAVTEAGLADCVLPINDIAPYLTSALATSGDVAATQRRAV